MVNLDKKSIVDLSTMIQNASSIHGLMKMLGFTNVNDTQVENIIKNIVKGSIFNSLKKYNKPNSIFKIVNGVCVSPSAYVNQYEHCMYNLYLFYSKQVEFNTQLYEYTVIIWSIVRMLQSENKKFSLNVNKFLKSVSDKVY
jgi:hypothetical protein